MSADYDPSNTQKLYGGTRDNNKQTSKNNGSMGSEEQPVTEDILLLILNTNFVYGRYVNGSVRDRITRE